jgi:hypothetical protein
MTDQVSDTSIQNHSLRMATLQDALLSFPYGSVILAMLINLVAGFLQMQHPAREPSGAQLRSRWNGIAIAMATHKIPAMKIGAIRDVTENARPNSQKPKTKIANATTKATMFMGVPFTAAPA